MLSLENERYHLKEMATIESPMSINVKPFLRRWGHNMIGKKVLQVKKVFL